MSFTDTPTVFIVDDDASVREGMAWLLRTRRLFSESFDSAEAFLTMVQGEGIGQGTAWQPDPSRLQQSGCILLDVRMPGMSGLALFEQLLTSGLAQAWPVIFLTGHADVPTAVDSVKRGAFDFCEKPFSDNALVDRVEQALALSQERLVARQTQQRLQSRLLELTERERDVMRLVVEGLPNKLIADQLDISVRTVEVHRARVFDKMEVKSAVELANLMRQLT
ncbi:MAG: LuxR C-terminal-related transcriptional regulator [Limnohabitans sp.]|jgi:two-component system, LuxR family, response regulator DctR|nr:LuxR C-terminal-related transcriptional regulator [Limnohabitans sp.]MDP4734975.1 LuxR C-terminal-related transcriptional regulator [Limnohabitans sp.]MDP4770738.1 LuxR C-terminal-related transcriptional regulator [Limnohabitans sp.]MDP4924207.1 LuxR C-terminal-related transcriptional regulator [Limnohabitans sp.]